MTDVSSVKAHAEAQPASVAFYGGPPPAYTNGSPALDATIEEEESSTIKCICGFSDDDGNTVLCEKCDTWQHIVCYYESAHHVPDVHECTDCHPRLVDAKSASDKQRLRRELNNVGERKTKPKTATKNHKKRVKDPLGSVQPNGWAVHSNNDLHYNSERKSGSPRDQPPPNKRPKTSHRTSGSVSMLSQAPALVPGSRKRASSTMHNGHSPVKSPTNPDGPNEEFSLEFMNLYRQQEVPPPDSNSFLDIRVANDLSLWLNDREALAEATGGKEPAQVFERIASPIEELDALAPNILKQTEEDTSITAHGLHPRWQFLTIETVVPVGAYIGELKGRIGRKDDYFLDPENRWDLLRHPEPFVFFPPHLPIYIDARQEGTTLKYIRRSCNPNVQMKILTQGPESGYHFCFIATQEIEPGEELTIGWEIDAQIYQRLGDSLTNGDIRKEGLKKIEPWVACVLSNFGGCACDTSRGRECLLERARRPNVYADPTPPAKSKGRKSKKTQVSPLSTGHATNSRAGSEAFIRNGADDDNMDSRSTSGSHKSSSRDITPATHFSVDGGEAKISDRERRKIQQQERLFEQLEYDEQHKGKRGKRNSAGSTLNTPGLSSSVRRSSRPTIFNANADEQKQLGHSEPSPSARNHREHSNGVARKTSGNSVKTNGRIVAKPKPVYVEASTQTDEDRSSTTPTPSSTLKTRVLKRPISFKHKLLQQAIEDRQQRDRIRSASVKTEARSPALKDVISSKSSPAPPSLPAEEPSAMDISTSTEPAAVTPKKEPTPPKEPTPSPPNDVDMQDVDEAIASRPSSPPVEEMPDAPKQEPSDASHPPTQPPPPLPSEDPTAPSAEPEPITTTLPSPKPVDLKVQPVSPDVANPPGGLNSAVTPGGLSAGAIAESPIGMSTGPSPFSQSVINAVNPGPARKKLSLSDYSAARRAKLASQNQSSSSVPTISSTKSESANSPTLSTSSLPNQTSPSGRTPEPAALPTVSEEPKTIT
jgi:hypothetical protein